jgi:carbonic anhydrase/acetyltransferase-like protein (isoleucine patch superfamily)
LYNRIAPCPNPAPIVIEENAWIGDHAMITKGVTIGHNSIVGAGAVVVNDVPPNSIAAGNPAKVVKELDPEIGFTTRAAWFKDPEKLAKQIDNLDKQMLKGNTLLGWIRHLLFPAPGD